MVEHEHVPGHRGGIDMTGFGGDDIIITVVEFLSSYQWTSLPWL
jgi:hypothetical protein